MSDEEVTKRMGQLLRKGAALLSTACPKCNTPLLRLKDGAMYCVKCDKEVVEQKSAVLSSDYPTPSGDILNQLASRVLVTLEVLIQSFPDKPHPEEIRTFAKTAKNLIEILKGIQELQR
ncbi:MAG: Sjogren's syndrome/scleroderma autoantigen 1 family protein [Candidatus Thorarchaeota archaeon]